MSQHYFETQPQYWGEFGFLPKDRLQLQCADLLLDLACGDKDWLLQYELKTTNEEGEACLNLMSTDVAGWNLANQQRFVSKQPPQKITLHPTMPDRQIVCRPTITVVLLPKEEISLYVGIPLWLQLSINRIKNPLLDVPTERISDTWFGPNSRQGIMSYALRTCEQLDIQPSCKHGARATIEIKIKNHSDEMLVLDKVSVPAPNLGLYVDEAGRFWTRRITMIREQDENATLTIDNAMSCGLASKDLTLVTEPRDDLGKGKITKALWALFG